MLTLLAQKTEPVGGAFFGLGPLGFQTTGLSPNISHSLEIFNRVFSVTIGVLTICGGLYFIFQFIIAAYDYLNAGGDMERIKNATRKITQAILGLIILVTAYAIISLLGNLIGLDILNPQDVIEKLGPTP
jgi:hypothetical protein